MTHAQRAWLTSSEPDRDLVRMLLVSVGLHVAAAAVVLVLPSGVFSRPPPPVVAYTVKIVDPNALGGRLSRGPLKPDEAPAGARDTVPQEKEEKPKPEEKKAEEKVEPPKPEEKAVIIPDEKKKAEEKKPPEKKPEAKPAPKKPSKAEVARVEREKRDKEIQQAIRKLGEKGRDKEAAGLGGVEEGKGGALGMGGDGGGGGILTGLDFILYKNQVEAIIKKNWTWVGANPNLTVRMGFRIAEGGEITDVRVVERSGDSSFDDSVMRAIRVSNPLPQPPERYRDVFGNYILDFVSGEMQG